MRPRASGSGPRFRAFTVDEYQDVNLLQQTLLELWLGERDDLCVVGDDYQSIYAFTGATPSLPAHDARPAVPAGGELPLEPAGARAREPARPAARRGGEDAACDARRTARSRSCARSGRARTRRHSRRAASCAAARGVRYEQMAVLYRTNARSEEYEEALAGRGSRTASARVGSSSARPRAGCCPCSAARPPRRSAPRCARLAEEQGLWPEPAEGLGEYELTRQQDLARLVRLAEELDDGLRTAAEFADRSRAAARGRERGRGGEPPDLSPCKGPRVRGRLPSPARAERASGPAGKDG